MSAELDSWRQAEEAAPNVRDLRRRTAAVEHASSSEDGGAREPARPVGESQGSARSASTPPRPRHDVTGDHPPRQDSREPVTSLRGPDSTPWEGYSTSQMLQTVMPGQPPRKATRGLRRRLGMKAGRAEQAEIIANEAMAASFGRPITVVLANPKGGAGKTPTALGLAAAFGRARGGGVLALEIHELQGTMEIRTLGQAGTVRDFLRNLPRLPRDLGRGDVEAYTRRQPAGLYEAMVSARARKDQLTAEEFAVLHQILSRFYSVIIVDTANNTGAPGWRAAVNTADVLVVPVKWRADYALPAVEMLQELQETHEDLVRRAVVVATHGSGEADPGTRTQTLPYFERQAAKVLELPTDPHIAIGREIVWDQLGQPYQSAARAAGQAVAEAVRPMHPRHPGF